MSLSSPSSLSISRLRQSWVSPTLMVRKTRSLSEVRCHEGWVLWCERRPEEAGRSVIVGRDPEGRLHDLTPSESNVITTVNEYGGGAWAVRSCKEGLEVFFSDHKRAGLWRSIMGAEAQPYGLSTVIFRQKEQRYADLFLTQEMLFCVRETHETGKVFMEVISLDAAGKVQVLVQGADFYAAPRPSPDGRFLAWVEWHNPNMPWTSTQLYVASLADTAQKQLLEGGKEACSVMEPFWEGNRLYALSDRSFLQHQRVWTPVAFEEEKGFWQDMALPPAPAEIGLPHWVFGQRSYVVFPGGEMLARGLRNGMSCLLHYHPWKGWKEVAHKGAPANVPEPLSVTFKNIMAAHYAWLDTPEDAPPAVVMGALNGPVVRLCQAWELPEGIGKDDIVLPRLVTVPMEEDTLYAFFYPPASGPHSEPYEGKPPLVVIVHGGPTGQAQTAFSFKLQWWTSRGFAVLDVNYRGSTGFGRAYRDALNGEWGVRDVQDCCDAVRYVQVQGWVDPARCIIRGSSAGGLTVLSALAQSDLFIAGTSLYGVTDLRALTVDTHRFEAHYLDGLIAPLPEGEAVYDARSPVNWPEKITAPVLFLHGAEDCVVPLAHAEALYKKLPQALWHVYPEEGHGFRAPDVQVDALQRELAFYQKVFSERVS